MDKKGLATEIKVARAKIGMNQVELAKASGISSCAIALIEAQKRENVRVATLIKLAEALKIDAVDLLKYLK